LQHRRPDALRSNRHGTSLLTARNVTIRRMAPHYGRNGPSPKPARTITTTGTIRRHYRHRVSPFDRHETSLFRRGPSARSGSKMAPGSRNRAFKWSDEARDRHGASLFRARRAAPGPQTGVVNHYSRIGRERSAARGLTISAGRAARVGPEDRQRNSLTESSRPRSDRSVFLARRFMRVLVPRQG
jgi:hypothetical protein